MPEKLQITLHYRRAVWLEEDVTRTLEQLLRDALKDRQDVGSRRYERGDGQVIECAHAPDAGHSMQLHIVAYHRDRPATVVELDDAAPETELRPLAPPDASAFMEGNLAAVVTGNHVFYCGRPIREGALAAFCYWLFRNTWPDENYDRFALQKVADVQKIGLIRRQGVRYIRFHGCMKPESMERILNEKRGLLDRLAPIAQAIVGEAPEVHNEEMADVVLEIDIKKRRMGPHIERTVSRLAEDIVEVEDLEYVIETRQGERITNRDIVLREGARLRMIGSSFDYEDAFEKLQHFRAGLMDRGLLEA